MFDNAPGNEEASSALASTTPSLNHKKPVASRHIKPVSFPLDLANAFCPAKMLLEIKPVNAVSIDALAFQRKIKVHAARVNKDIKKLRLVSGLKVTVSYQFAAPTIGIFIPSMDHVALKGLTRHEATSWNIETRRQNDGLATRRRFQSETNDITLDKLEYLIKQLKLINSEDDGSPMDIGTSPNR
jgi:hypothetical protein